MRIYIRPRFRFYPQEIADLAVAVVILTVSMDLLLSGIHFSLLLFLFPVALLAVLTGFLMHEMLHKYFAFRFGYPAAFRAWYTGLLIALFSSFFGFLFAAPGAVVVHGFPTRRENGIISAAGPLSNITVGFVLLSISFLIHGFFGFILLYVALFNFFLAFFNLLPFPPMDGLKILSWNAIIYAALLALSVGGLIISYWL